MATQFSGGSYINATFTGNIKADILVNLAAQLVNAGWTNLAMAAGQGPGNYCSGVSISIATPGVVSWTGHGFLGGEKIIFQISAGGTMPTGISVNTSYYVKYVNANSFNVSASSGGANINTTGSTSGTITCYSLYYLLQSATQTGVTNGAVVKIQDGSSCAVVSVQNAAGTAVGGNSSSAGGYLLPAASKTFRVIATKYHFLCFVPGAPASCGFVMAGMYYVPSFVTGTTDASYMLCNTNADNGTGYTSFRTAPWISQGSNTGNLQVIYNNNICENANNNLGSGTVGCPSALVVTYLNAGASAAPISWVNNDLNSSDILLASGLGSMNTSGLIHGQFFDLLYTQGSFVVDVTDTFASHNWWNLTNNHTSGSVWMATS